MKSETGGKQGLRRAAALAVPAATVLLVTACGVVHVHFGSPASTPPAPSPTSGYLAYAQCMRAHGISGFPTPSPSGTASEHFPGGPDGAAARANAACKPLLPGGGAAAGGATTPAATTTP